MSSFEPQAEQAELRFVPQPIGLQSDFTRDGEPPSPAPGSAEPGVSPEAEAAEALRAALAAEYERGVTEGRSDAGAALVQPLAALGRASRALAEQRTLYLQQQRGLLIQLALQIAGRIVQHELTTDPALLASLVDRAIERLDEESPIVVQLSTSDHAAASRGAGALSEIESDDVRIEASRELADGEARVVSGAATIEARVATMLERFGEELVDWDDLPAPDGQEGAS